MDVIIQGSGRPARTIPRWLWFVGIGLVVAIALAGPLDSWLRDQEEARLTSAHEDVLRDIERVEANVWGTVEYAGPLLQVGTPQTRSDLQDLVLAELTTGRDEVVAESRRLSEAWILPWHTEQLQLRDELISDLALRTQSLTETVLQILTIP